MSSKEVLECLQALSAPGSGPAEVARSEARLTQLAQKPGYSIFLASIFSDGRLPFHIKQQAGFCLKNLIVEKWHQSSKNFKPPMISDKEKKQLRDGLPNLLNTENGKLRTVASMCIAVIGNFDYPENWPSLLPSLVKCLNDHTKPNLAQGSLRTILLLAEDLTDSQIVEAIPSLLPALLRILKEMRFSRQVRAQSIRIYRTCLSSIVTAEPEQASKFLGPTFKSWLEAIHFVLKSKVDLQDGAESSILQLESARVLRVLQITRTLKTELAPYRKLFFGTVEQAAISLFDPYLELIVSSESKDVAFDDDGDRIGFEVYITHLLGFLTRALKQEIQSINREEALRCLGRLAKLGLGFMRITYSELGEWESDPDEFIYYEDNLEMIFTVRAAATSLVDAVVGLGEPGLKPVLNAVAHDLKVANKMKKENNHRWWILHEAALYSCGLLIESASESKESCQKAMWVFRNAVLPNLIKPDKRFSFCYARSVWCISQYASLLELYPDCIPPAFEGMVNAFNPKNNIVVRWCAMRALGMCCTTMKPEDPNLLKLLSTCIPLACPLLVETKGDTLGLCLETILLSISVNEKIAIQVEPSVTALLLSIWERNTGSSMITEAINEILVMLSRIQGCAQSVLSRSVPYMIRVVTQAASGRIGRNQLGVVERAIDLLSMMMQEWKGTSIPKPFFAVIEPLFKLMLTTEDNSALQSGTSLITHFLKRSKAEMLSGKVGGRPALEIIGRILARLLDDKIPDLAACYAGGLVKELVFNYAKELGGKMTNNLIRAVVCRLLTAEHPALIEDLVMVLARLVHAQGTTQFIQSMAHLRVQGRSALNIAMKAWTKNFRAFYSSFQKKVAAIALANLLKTGDRRLYGMTVQVERIQQVEGKRATRSNSGKQSVEVSLATCICEILAGEYHEEMVQAVMKENIGDDEEEDSYVDLSDLLHMNALGIEAECEEDPEIKNDPLYEVDLLEFIPETFRHIQRNRSSDLKKIAQQMTPEGRDKLEAAMTKRAVS